jgi:hypothetical protein
MEGAISTGTAKLGKPATQNPIIALQKQGSAEMTKTAMRLGKDATLH